MPVDVSRGQTRDDERRKKALLLALSLGSLISGIVLIENARRSQIQPTDPPWPAWGLFLVAAIALEFGNRSSSSETPSVFPQPHVAMWDQKLLAGTAICSVLSIPLFMKLNTSEAHPGVLIDAGSWTLYIGSIFLALLTLVRTSPKENRLTPVRRWRRLFDRRTLLPLSLLGAALFLRMMGLGDIPAGLWFDEAQNALAGSSFVEPESFHPVFVSGLTQLGGFYLYGLGTSLTFFGHTDEAIRYLPAISGALVVPLVFRLTTPLFGRSAGIFSSLFVLFSSWHLTFSRIGFMSMTSVAIDVAVYLFFFRGLRTGRVAWFGFAGLLLGIGLQMYFYVSILTLVVLSLVWIYQSVKRRLHLRVHLQQMTVFAVALLVSALPMVLLTVQRPEVIGERSRAASLFSENGGGIEALDDNLRAHALMFNWQGDRNGRHNIPDEPMLDPIMGGLMVSGLSLSVSRIRREQNLFLIAWFSLMLLPGVLSLSFEAPQALRTLENSVVGSVLAAVFLAELVKGFSGTWGGKGSRVLISSIVLLTVAGMAALNLHRYFIRQANHPQVWAEMSGAEAWAARELSNADPDAVVKVSPGLLDHPTVRWMAGDVEASEWTGLNDLPFSEERDHRLIVHASRIFDLSYILDLYPGARTRAYGPPGWAHLLYSIEIPKEDIEATHGVVAHRKGRSITLESITSPRSIPVSRIRAVIRVDDYRPTGFTWVGTGSPTIEVDGERWGRTERPLAAGLHVLEVDEIKGDGHVAWTGNPKARWAAIPPESTFHPRAVRIQGLTGLYRSGDTFQGPPDIVRIDPQIAAFFDPTRLARPYTIEWSGRLFAPKTGTYDLGTEQISTSELWLDGAQVVANDAHNLLIMSSVHLESGWHDIDVRFRDLDGHSHVFLHWKPPGGDASIVPSSFLAPVLPERLSREPVGVSTNPFELGQGLLEIVQSRP